MHAGLQPLLERGGDKALVPVRAVVGHDVQVVACILELVHQDEQAGRAEADDHVHIRARLVQRLGLRIGDGDAQTPADDRDLFALLALELARLAQRADEILQRLALLERVQPARGRADLLKNDRDRALFPVIARDGQRDTLALLVDAQDDELARLRLSRNARRLDLHQRHRVVQAAFGYDWVQNPFLLCFCAANCAGCSDLTAPAFFLSLL